jgi:hypothetical protein
VWDGQSTYFPYVTAMHQQGHRSATTMSALDRPHPLTHAVYYNPEPSTRRCKVVHLILSYCAYVCPTDYAYWKRVTCASTLIDRNTTRLVSEDPKSSKHIAILPSPEAFWKAQPLALSRGGPPREIRTLKCEGLKRRTHRFQC